MSHKNQRRTILGIDQSYTMSGFCILVEGNDIPIHYSTFATQKGDSIFVRAMKVADYIIKLMKRYNIEYSCIEGLAFGIRGSATRDLAGLQFVIITRILNEHFSASIVAPLSLKKFATGNGRAKKIDMFNALPTHIQHDLTNTHKFLKTKGLYDVTDAYFIAKYALSNPINLEPITNADIHIQMQ